MAADSLTMHCYSGLLPSVKEVTPGLSDTSITHHLFQRAVTGLGKVLLEGQERLAVKSSSDQSVEYLRMQLGVRWQ